MKIMLKLNTQFLIFDSLYKSEFIILLNLIYMRLWKGEVSKLIIDKVRENTLNSRKQIKYRSSSKDK